MNPLEKDLWSRHLVMMKSSADCASFPNGPMYCRDSYEHIHAGNRTYQPVDIVESNE